MSALRISFLLKVTELPHRILWTAVSVKPASKSANPVESTGALSPEEIIERAAEILKERIRLALDYANSL